MICHLLLRRRCHRPQAGRVLAPLPGCGFLGIFSGGGDLCEVLPPANLLASLRLAEARRSITGSVLAGLRLAKTRKRKRKSKPRPLACQGPCAITGYRSDELWLAEMPSSINRRSCVLPSASETRRSISRSVLDSLRLAKTRKRKRKSKECSPNGTVLSSLRLEKASAPRSQVSIGNVSCSREISFRSNETIIPLGIDNGIAPARALVRKTWNEGNRKHGNLYLSQSPMR